MKSKTWPMPLMYFTHCIYFLSVHLSLSMTVKFKIKKNCIPNFVTSIYMKVKNDHGSL